MTIHENYSLKNYNTFGIDVKARFFAEVTGLMQLRKLLDLSVYPNRFVLGGGSNLLLIDDIDALVMHIALKGIHIFEEEEDYVIIKAMAGENWHELVLWCLEKDYGGIENLSLIPGNTGTAPIQNIGAYGVELKDVFVSCEAMDMESLELVELTKKDCQFGYRDSIFKGVAKGKYIITSVKLRLTKKAHIIRTDYGGVQDQLEQMGVKVPGIQEVSRAIIHIRQKKLPDPSLLGNSGSFFKNPVLEKSRLLPLQDKHPEMPVYEVSETLAKLPAGWLIDQCGLKGYRQGDAGVHERQALVLVNYGNASGQDVLQLARTVQDRVEKEFGIRLEPEVNILP